MTEPERCPKCGLTAWESFHSWAPCSDAFHAAPASEPKLTNDIVGDMGGTGWFPPTPASDPNRFVPGAGEATNTLEGATLNVDRCPCGDRPMATCSGECVDPERYNDWKIRQQGYITRAESDAQLEKALESYGIHWAKECDDRVVEAVRKENRRCQDVLEELAGEERHREEMALRAGAAFIRAGADTEKGEEE